MRFEGKVALVTGSSRGIGMAIAQAFAGDGADVVINYVSNAQAAEAVVETIAKLGRRSFSFQADVCNYAQVHEMIQKTLTELGKIDILVNNAGVSRDSTVGKMSEEVWDEVIGVNLKGVFNCTKAVINHMKERGYGKIINISSVVGQVGGFGVSNYSASKAGVFGFTKSVAKEVAQKGITVNALTLGYFDVGMLRRLPEDIQEQVRQQIPMGRFGKLEEVTGIVLFLASEAANYITGQVIHVNGGYYM